MAEPSRPPNCSAYGVPRVCHGCQRKLVISQEPALLFTGWPVRGVFGKCCMAAGLNPLQQQEAA